MNKLSVLSLLAVLVLTSCSTAEDPQPEVTETVEQPVPEVEVVEEEIVTAPTTDIYYAIDAACGTSIGPGSQVVGTGSDASANALFVGMKSTELSKLECILSETESTITVADLEAGVYASAPTMWISGSGAWGGNGVFSPLGDDAMITLNLYFLPA